MPPARQQRGTAAITALLTALGSAAPGAEAHSPQSSTAAAEAATPGFSPVMAAGIGAIAGVTLITLARSGGGGGSRFPSQSCTADDREPDSLTRGAIEPAPSGQDFNSTRPAPRPTSAWLCAPRHDPEDFRTSAYRAHAHLEAIGLAEAYQWGYFGEDVTIGVVDSLPEASHTAFRNRIQVESIVGGSDDESHGTEVAGVAAANPVDHDQARPVHGVAPQAEVFGVGVADEADTISQNALREGVERMVARDVPIINISLGLVGGDQPLVGRNSVPRFLQRAMESAYGAVLGEDSVIVHAAGNSGLEGLAADAGLPALNDEFEPHFLTVTAVDGDGRISDFSNRCDGHDWCLAAPGRSIRTTTLDDGSATVSGTSFSAPMAAGAMAVTMSRFPGLTAREARVRLLESADSTGRYGDESVYGRGLMDLAAALEPIGGLALQTGGTLYEKEVALEQSAMTSSQAWGGAVAAGLGQVRTLAFDRYGGGFEVALDAGVREQPHGHDLDGWMRRHLQRPPTRAAESGFRLNARSPALQAVTAALPATPEGLALDALADHGVYFGLVHDRIDVTVGYANHDPDGALPVAAPRTHGLWADSVVRGPVLGLSAPLSAAHPHGPRLGLHWARLDERDGALGLRGAGGLAVDDSRHQVLGGELLLPVGPATAHLTYERVEVDVGRAGVVALDDVTAHGWGAALTLPGVTATDAVQLGFQRPVHVDGGRLSVRSVTGRDADGTLSYATDTARLAAPHDPVRWHATYTRPLTGDAVQGRFAVGYQHDRLGTGVRVDAVSAGVVVEW